MKKVIMSFLLILVSIFSISSITSRAISENNDSDITKGKITFYEEDFDKPETEQSSILPNINTNQSNDASIPKKIGLLPQTGENFLELLPYLIGVSILILLILYRREKKE